MSNLGSSLGTAIAGTVLVAGIAATPQRSYALAMIVLAALGLVGFVAVAFRDCVRISSVGTTRAAVLRRSDYGTSATVRRESRQAATERDEPALVGRRHQITHAG